MDVRDAPQHDEVDLEELIRVIWQRKTFILTVVILCSLLAYVLVQQMPNIYRSQVTIMFKKSAQSNDAIQSLITGAMTAADSTETELELVKNKTLLMKVVDDLKMHEHPAFQVNQTQKPNENVQEQLELRKQSALTDLSANVSVKQKSGTDLVTISYESQDPVLAANVVNKIGNTFIEFKERLMAGKHVQGTELLGTKLQEVKKNLTDAEYRIVEYQNEHQFIDIKNAVALTNKKLVTLHEQKDAISQSVEQKSIVKQHILNNQTDVDVLLSIPGFANSVAVAEHQEQIKAYSRAFAKTKLRYGYKHPKYIEAKQLLNDAKKELIAEVNKQLERIDKQVEIEQEQLTLLSKEIDLLTLRLNQLGVIAFDYEKLKREFDANLELYENLVKKQNESELMQDLTNSSNTILIESAEISQVPVKPNRKLIIVISALASLLLASLVVLIEYMLGDKVIQYRKVAQRFGTKVIGNVPKIKVKRSKQKGVLTELDNAKHAGFIESIRSIRTLILLDKVRSKHKVIAITSISPNDGKSTLAMQLAESFSEVGKTVLVDADLRFPSIAEALQEDPNRPGLTNVIARSHEVDDVIHEPANFKFEVLTSGQIPKNPLMFLQHSRFKVTLNELKVRFQRVILECPPIMSVSDAFIVSKCVDCVYLVVDSTKANGLMLANVLEELQQADVEVGGIIVNKVKESNTYSANRYYSYNRASANS